MKPDESHDPNLKSWVDSALNHPEFPIQNLPLGVFSLHGEGADHRRGGVAIGDMVLDVSAAATAGLFAPADLYIAKAASQGSLNDMMALGPDARRIFRHRVSRLLDDSSTKGREAKSVAKTILHTAGECEMHAPARIGGFTDFYAGIYHAINGGKRRRIGMDPLLPNYRHVPVAYHSRASSIMCSPSALRRPNGQRQRDGEGAPCFGPSEMVDFELELGAWIGQGNALGEPIFIDSAERHIAGYCLLNDCSSRDVQRWESQPLGPFLSKNFGTVISPWVVTPEALLPFKSAPIHRGDDDPQPLPYLYSQTDQQAGALDIGLEVWIRSEKMRLARYPHLRISTSNTKYLYWTVAQMIAHHTCGGCNLQPGDLIGTGTISADVPSGYGSIHEISEHALIELPSGEKRRFLEDGDEVMFRAHARKEGYASIGFGECVFRLLPTKQYL
jgi:fumarylacetoacetase